MPTLESATRVLALCVVLAGAETLHGIARTVWVVPHLGKARALKLSALTGSLLALGICMLLVPGIAPSTLGAQLALGATLATFMAAFDVAMVKLLLRKPWHQVWPDFNPATGNYLLYGLLFLVLVPALVMAMRGA